MGIHVHAPTTFEGVPMKSMAIDSEHSGKRRPNLHFEPCWPPAVCFFHILTCPMLTLWFSLDVSYFVMKRLTLYLYSCLVVASKGYHCILGGLVRIHFGKRPLNPNGCVHF